MTSRYLNFEEQLITGKNIPSKLKFRKLPFIGVPLNVKVIIGIVKSKAHPITSAEDKYIVNINNLVYYNFLTFSYKWF